MKISRVVSGLIALTYLGGAYYMGGGEAAFKTGMFLILPMACIWFSEGMGSSVGGPFVTSPTPGCFVLAGGWLVLLSPVIYAIIVAIGS
jgi:hypothetical protein